MSDTQNQPQYPTAPAAGQVPDDSPASVYGRACQKIEEDYTATLTAADGDYSRVTTYAGLVRQELVNAAVQRRTAAHERAAADYELAIASRPVQVTNQPTTEGND